MFDPLLDIDNVGVARFPTKTEPEIEAALSANTLQMADVTGYIEYRTENATTCANLADFSFFGTPIDVATEYTEAGGTYMLLLTEGTTPGVGARMLTFLDPTGSSSTTRVDVQDGCGLLDLDADLTSLAPTPIKADGPWDIDWSGLTVDGQGGEIPLTDVDGVLLGFYEGMTAADLEAQLLDLEYIATRLYTAPVESGTTADLALASGDAGTFAGFEGDGTWLLALTCSRCYNPAPLFLTVLDPVEAP